MWRQIVPGICGLALAGGPAWAEPGARQIDEQVRAGMARTGAKGLALATIENGKVIHTRRLSEGTATS